MLVLAEFIYTALDVLQAQVSGHEDAHLCFCACMHRVTIQQDDTPAASHMNLYLESNVFLELTFFGRVSLDGLHYAASTPFCLRDLLFIASGAPVPARGSIFTLLDLQPAATSRHTFELDFP